MGIWRGAGTTCGANSCPLPEPTGACCIPENYGFRCVIVTRRLCDGARGRYAGDGSTCAQAACGAVGEDCACDINNDGILDIADVRAFMEDFEAGNADFDGDGDTDTDDAIAFMQCIRDVCN